MHISGHPQTHFCCCTGRTSVGCRLREHVVGVTTCIDFPYLTDENPRESEFRFINLRLRPPLPARFHSSYRGIVVYLSTFALIMACLHAPCMAMTWCCGFTLCLPLPFPPLASPSLPFPLPSFPGSDVLGMLWRWRNGRMMMAMVMAIPIGVCWRRRQPGEASKRCCLLELHYIDMLGCTVFTVGNNLVWGRIVRHS